ncbi:MAG TPA: gamma-glutamyl-gamma-aminobutyrate hydrolase family protein [Candidatus Angelobacter sp.]|nr:gamma-glutamyl-gamma-aminobutyrate hydrolase family protein [Candidatus Angelobacter sp.]
MRPKIAIPDLHSRHPEYAQRALPQYIAAIEKAGGEAVVIRLEQSSTEIAKQLAFCHGALLPGSRADVDPQKYDAPRHPKTEEADVLRDAADELLLQDAHNLRKPILGICYGLQSLNVWRTGTLVQDIPSQVKTTVNHAAGRSVIHAHRVRIDPFSSLARMLHHDPEIGTHLQEAAHELNSFDLEVNSSHHQSADVVGDGLRVSARCPDDNVVEALEGTAPGHFVVAVQWHPERSYDDEPLSRALFRAFVKAAAEYK